MPTAHRAGGSHEQSGTLSPQGTRSTQQRKQDDSRKDLSEGRSLQLQEYGDTAANALRRKAKPMAVTANKLELMQIADAVAREKSIDKMIVIEAMEDALSRAARSRYGQETNVRAEIDPQTGETRLWRLMEVVEEVENDAAEISLKVAQKQNPEAEIGDFLSEPLPPVIWSFPAPPSRTSSPSSP